MCKNFVDFLTVRLAVCTAILQCFVWAATPAVARDREGGLDGFSQAAESYRAGEAERLERIARQLDLNRRMLGTSGYYGPAIDAFEPWPRVPGDVYGYQSIRPVEQPVGHESAQTGPNRWIYRPIYATVPVEAPPVVVVPRAGARPAPAVVPQPAEPRRAFELPKPSDAEPGDYVPPDAAQKKPAPVGRREF